VADSYSPNLKLATPTPGTRTWNNELDGNRQILDRQNAVGDLAVTTSEVPSASLAVDIAAGLFLNQGNQVTSFAGATAVAVTASTTTYIYLTSAGVLTMSTAGFPATPALFVPLATVVAGSVTITSIADARCPFTVVGSGYMPLTGGTLADGANIAVGSSTGTMIATSSTQRVGFFGKQPATQPVMGSATAGGSYSSNEQNMLNAAYAALRGLGLGS
jgi:hypothetical protein